MLSRNNRPFLDTLWLNHKLQCIYLGSSVLVELELGVLVFVDGGKSEKLEKKSKIKRK